MKEEGLVGAAEAARYLGVKLTTLYAYASRGLLRSVPDASGRRRMYLQRDLERLKARSDARAGHGPVAAGALRFGEPVLDSAITEIRPTEGPYYRGKSAVALAEEGTSFEEVMELLWSGELPVAPPARERGAPPGLRKLLGLVPSSASPLSALQLAVPWLAIVDPARLGAAEAAERARAKKMIFHLAALSGAGLAPTRVAAALSAGTVAGALQVALLGGAEHEEKRPAIDRALVLLADHELNASTFAARVAASAGADLYACVSAALATVSGPLHGGACDRVEALVEEAGRPERARAVVIERSRRGEGVPGFGQPLYPEGDPRARPLLEAALAHAPKKKDLRTLTAIVSAMEDAGREPPSVDTGLVALTLALGMPRGSATVLFAIGRSAGWIAHALEQREMGVLLRPRARFVGRRP